MIYISYGMMKTASSMLNMLIRRIYVAAGHHPTWPGCEALDQSSIVWADVIDRSVLADLTAQVGHDNFVIRTHSRPSAEALELVRAGEVLACASIRDPREIALSMMDHGAMNRKQNAVSMADIHEPHDALAMIDGQVSDFNGWTSVPETAVFTYDEIAFDTPAVVHRLIAQTGFDVDPAPILRAVANRRRAPRFNRGIAMRFVQMDEAQQARFLERYAAVYDRFGFDRRTAATDNLERVMTARPPGPMERRFHRLLLWMGR